MSKNLKAFEVNDTSDSKILITKTNTFNTVVDEMNRTCKSRENRDVFYELFAAFYAVCVGIFG